MRTYQVEFLRIDRFSVSVGANSVDEAVELATEVICQSEEPYNEYGIDDSGFQCKSVEIND